MNLQEIKKAIQEGLTVCWSNEGYEVQKSKFGEYNIVWLADNNCIGLTWLDGITLNGQEEEFYIKDKKGMVLVHSDLMKFRNMCDKIINTSNGVLKNTGDFIEWDSIDIKTYCINMNIDIELFLNYTSLISSFIDYPTEKRYCHELEYNTSVEEIKKGIAAYNVSKLLHEMFIDLYNNVTMYDFIIEVL